MATSSYLGFYKGVVCNTVDPENRGRIKCLIPDVLGATIESAWCEPCVPVAYDNGGDLCIPRLKETMWLSFEKGDVNKPIYFGNWWQKNMTPLGANYAGGKDTTRVINYGNCTITMTNGTIKINVGGGDGDLNIQDNQVTVQGNLKVTGSVNCGRITTTGINSSGSVNAPNINN